MNSTDKPGGWVDGIGWVAPEAALDDRTWVKLPNYVIVTRWADGSTPEPPKRLPDVTELPEWPRIVAATELPPLPPVIAKAWPILRRLVTAVESRGDNDAAL